MSEVMQHLFPKIQTLDSLAYFCNLPLKFRSTSTERISELEYIDQDHVHKDFKYNINPYGYRGDWSNILNPDIKKIGFFGCSFTFGQSCPEKYIFPSLVQKLLNNKYQTFNFGTIGGSHFRMGKILNAATNFITLDYAVFLLPPKYRFLAVNNKSELFELIPSLDDNGYPHFSGSFKELYKCLNDENFTLMQLDYIGWMLDRCLSKGVRPLFSSWDNDTYQLLRDNISEQYILPKFFFNGKDKRFVGRDLTHPGPLPHQIFAHTVVSKL